MNKVLTSFLVIGLVTGIGFALTQAFFSDTETSPGNTMTAGAVDLQIANESYYRGNYNTDTSWELKDVTENEKFFNFDDIKPGDWGQDTIELVVNTNPSWACAEITVTANDDNTCVGPESEVDSCVADNADLFDGEIAQHVSYMLWRDDGDNVLENDEEPLIFSQGKLEDIGQSFQAALADSQMNLFTGNPEPLQPNTPYYIGKAWCFGNMTPDPVAQGSENSPENNPGFTCDDAGIGNAPQTDIFTADIAFSVVQQRNNTSFVCPADTSCGPELAYATSATETFGTKKNGNPVDANRTILTNVAGAPENVISPPSFVSLGFGGIVTAEFSSPVGDGAGNDIEIYEITGGRASYPEEKALVEVSADGVSWFGIGTASSEPAPSTDGVTQFDISTHPFAPNQISYVRLTDTTDPAPHIATADGFDLDAVGALYAACEEIAQ
jgi:hypothetical protein